MTERPWPNPPHDGAFPGSAAGTFLTLGHVLDGIGAEHDPPIGVRDIYLIRHTFQPGGHEGLQGPEDLTADRVLQYTRSQNISTRLFPADPGPYWVVLIADGKRRSRLWGTFHNRGELVAQRTATDRYFDLRPSGFLAPLVDRLVIEWVNPRRWHRRATNARGLPVLEISDRDKVPFPGFDSVRLPFHELTQMVADHRYSDWRVALSEVQGIYLITDSSNGKQYVGKAAGAERILQRWTAYARDGHGGNRALRELADASVGRGGAKTDHARHFVFSILRVFGPSTSSSEVDAAESHYKEALMTRQFGLNRN
ncbi:GIY-YIG nuclease family protein [Mycolicibacterium peregrinum]|uniref:GIY-YIG nuclease family protein n=1 Tax=Mycolicibacterium peregrinum TaxID=43304 RepID=UPI000DA2615D|nr:GIY-YIG nuclease family protein [Mycolicibacterium peregrinum]